VESTTTWVGFDRAAAL